MTLTDESYCQLWQDNKDSWQALQEPFPATRRIMRAAYDLGRDEQLEQVIEWLNETISERGSSLEAINIPEELRGAMRPTQENN